MAENEKAIYIEMGRQDFEKGIPCIPAESETLMIYIESRKNNTPLMEAWVQGWKQAQNLKKT